VKSGCWPPSDRRDNSGTSVGVEDIVPRRSAALNSVFPGKERIELGRKRLTSGELHSGDRLRHLIERGLMRADPGERALPPAAWSSSASAMAPRYPEERSEKRWESSRQTDQSAARLGAPSGVRTTARRRRPAGRAASRTRAGDERRPAAVSGRDDAEALRATPGGRSPSSPQHFRCDEGEDEVS